MKLFKVRFSLRTQQHQERFPQATRSLLARIPSDVLASGALCIASEYVRDRPFSLDSRPSRIGSSAWFSLLCVLGLSPASRSPFGVKLRWLGQFLLAHVLVSVFPFSLSEVGASLLHFSTQLGPLCWRGLSRTCVPCQKRRVTGGRGTKFSTKMKRVAQQFHDDISQSMLCG